MTLTVKDFLQLTRALNLGYIVLCMYLIRYCLIEPIYGLLTYEPTLSHLAFAALVLSTVLIAAGGYVINDYFDQQTDLINKPDKVLIGKKISAQQSVRLYAVLTIAGILIGGVLAYMMGSWRLIFVHLFSAAALWFYSSSWKRKPLIGNVMVSILVALSVLIVAFFDRELLNYLMFSLKESLGAIFERLTDYEVSARGESDVKESALSGFIVQQILGLSLFAFLLNLIREIIKDGQDVMGDGKMGYRTFPIITSLATSNLLTAALCVLTFYLLFRFQMTQMDIGNRWVAAAIFVLIQLPLLYLVFRSKGARTPKQFKHMSAVVKLIMFLGLLYLPYLASSVNVEQPDETVIELPPGYTVDDIELEVIDPRTGKPMKLEEEKEAEPAVEIPVTEGQQSKPNQPIEISKDSLMQLFEGMQKEDEK